MNSIGRSGEKLVSQWLQSQGWQLLYQGWRCRWGEIDLIVRSSKQGLAFVEVKTRSRNSLDRQGLLAVNPSKQAKIYRTAEIFLSRNAGLADLPCRFDVALVVYQACNNPPAIATPSILFEAGYLFKLHQYIESAFD